MCRGGFASCGHADRIKLTWHTRSAAGLPLLSLRPCPRRPAQALSDPGKPFSRQLARPPAPGSFFVSSAQAVCAVGRATATSFGGLVASASPAPRRFAPRTTDMAPMLRHADPCRASPCRPRRLLSASGRARPRSRALSSPGAKAAEAAPTPGMLSLESSSSFALLLGDLLNHRLVSAAAVHKIGQVGRCQQRKLPDVGSALRSCNAELAAAKRRPLPPGCAPATPAVPRSSRRRTSGGTRLRLSPPLRRSRLTKGLTQTGGNNLTSWPSFSRPR